MARQGVKNKNPILLEFARKVRIRRFELGLTQEQLAERADCHTNFVGGIERATRNPSITTVIKLAKALELSPRKLLPE